MTAAALPHSSALAPAGFALPADACDCHMHVFDNRFPYAGPNVIRHADASVAQYRALQQRLGLSRNVVVQPSSYGTDNRVLLQALRDFGPQARGVAVVDASVDDETLQGLVRERVVGVRFNLVQKAATSLQTLLDLAPRLRESGLHAQLHLPVQDLVAQAERLCALRLPLVIDHFARINTVPALAAEAEAALLRLLDTGHVWMKLSGAYTATAAIDQVDLEPFARRMVDRFAHRLVWASDWPHATEPQPKPDDARLLNALARYAPQAARRQAILVDNPACLYGFGR